MFRVSPFGYITREACGWRYSGQWTMRGLARIDNFGNVAERVPFAELAAFIRSGPALTHANGKPRWHVQDVDHGTPRQWGDGITSIRIMEG